MGLQRYNYLYIRIKGGNKYERISYEFRKYSSAVAVYFGVLILVPKLCKDKFINKK